MGLNLQESECENTTKRKAGSLDQSLRDRVQAGDETIEAEPRPNDGQIKRNLDGATTIFELPEEKIYVSAAELRIERGQENLRFQRKPSKIWASRSHIGYVAKKNRSRRPGDSGPEGHHVEKGKTRIRPETQPNRRRRTCPLYPWRQPEHEFGYSLSPEDIHWLRGSLCQILTP